MRQKPADCHVSELRVRFSRSCASEKSRATLCPWRWFYKAIYIRVSILLVSPLKASSLSGWLASPRPLTFSAPGRRSAQSRLQMGMKHAGRVKQTHADAGMFWLFLQSNEWQGFKTLHSRVRTNIKIRNEWMIKRVYVLGDDKLAKVGISIVYRDRFMMNERLWRYDLTKDTKDSHSQGNKKNLLALLNECSPELTAIRRNLQSSLCVTSKLTIMMIKHSMHLCVDC